MNFSTIITRYDPLGETSITHKLLLALLGTKVGMEIIGMGIVVRLFPPTKGSIIKLAKAGVAYVPTANQGFNQQVVLGQGWGGNGGGSTININLPHPLYPPYSNMMAPMVPFQRHPHPHHYSNNVSNVHNVAGVSNATSYGNDSISTFSDNAAAMARRGNGNDETTTLSTTMQQRYDGTAAVSSSAAMAGGASSNRGNGGSSSRGELLSSSSSSVQTASQAPAKQSITTSSLKRTGQSNGPAVPAALQRTNPQALPFRPRNASPSDNAAVHEAEHKNDDDYNFNDDNYSVASDNENGSVSSTKSYYKGLCAQLTEALNAKKEENKSIKQENKRLKKDIDDLKKENNDLKKEINDLKNCKPSSITYNNENNCNRRSLYHRKSHK